MKVDSKILAHYPDALLKVIGLKTYFHLEEGILKAVDGITFGLNPGKTLALVGESGCGKSVTAMSVIRLIESPPGRIESGQMVFKGVDLLRLTEKEMRRYRGKEIAMVFQEPLTSLNPVFTVGDQISEVYKLHQKLKRKEAMERSVEMLKLVGIPMPEKRIKDYPHELSGGQRQRVLIAMALACRPSLLIADEPTTALDVTIQAQILDLLNELKKKFSMTVLLITHDLGIVAQNADEVVVMYAGRIMEYTTTERLFERPMHPYTQALQKALLYHNDGARGARIPAIPGMVPRLMDTKDECRFSDRCPLAADKCREGEPKLREIEPFHFVRCVKV